MCQYTTSNTRCTSHCPSGKTPVDIIIRIDICLNTVRKFICVYIYICQHILVGEINMVRFWCIFNVKLYWFVVAHKHLKFLSIPLNTQSRQLYLKPQSVPRCKHFSSRLQKPISLFCKGHK